MKSDLNIRYRDATERPENAQFWDEFHSMNSGKIRTEMLLLKHMQRSVPVEMKVRFFCLISVKKMGVSAEYS